MLLRAARAGRRALSTSTAPDAPESVSAAWMALGLSVVGGGGTALYTYRKEASRLADVRAAGEQTTTGLDREAVEPESEWRVVAAIGPWPSKDASLLAQTVTAGGRVSGFEDMEFSASLLSTKVGPRVRVPLKVEFDGTGKGRARATLPLVNKEMEFDLWHLHHARSAGSSGDGLHVFGDGDSRQRAWVLCRAAKGTRKCQSAEWDDLSPARKELRRRGYAVQRLWTSEAAFPSEKSA